MADKREQQVFLNASQCAAQLGMSVRALRFYEQHGLIRPHRTQKHWRLYGASEIARLHEIQVLKRFGLSLSEMARIFGQETTDIGRTLAVQQDLLTDQLSHAQQGLMLIAVLRRRLEAGEVLSTSDLLELAKGTKMTKASTDAIAWRRYEQMRPRTEVEIDRSVLPDYTGAYRLDDGTHYFVVLKEGRLFTRVAGQTDIEIVPESETAFFMRDLPVQVTFIRDAEGLVNDLVHHQHGLEVLATRVNEASARQAEADILERVSRRMPAAGSEAILHRIIDGLQTGEPDYDLMTPALAEATREQLGRIQSDLAEAGSLSSLEFKGVGSAGWDVYDAQFANTRVEWRLHMGANGKVTGLLLRELP